MIHHYATSPAFSSNFTVTSSQNCVWSKKLLPLVLLRGRHHSAMKGYKNWCNAMTSASKMVETMSQNSLRYVHQMATYMVCNIFLFFFPNSPSELTFWIILVCQQRFKKCFHPSGFALTTHNLQFFCRHTSYINLLAPGIFV